MKKLFIYFLLVSMLVTGCDFKDTEQKQNSNPAPASAEAPVSLTPADTEVPTPEPTPLQTDEPVQFVPEENLTTVLKNAYDNIAGANSVEMESVYKSLGTLYGLDIGTDEKFTTAINIEEREHISEGKTKTESGESEHKFYRFGNYFYTKKNNSNGYFIEKFSRKETDDYFKLLPEIFDFLNPELIDTRNMNMRYRKSQQDYMITGSGYQPEILARTYAEDKFWLMEYAGMTFDDMDTKILIDENFNIKSLSITSAQSMFINIEIKFISIDEYTGYESKDRMLAEYPLNEESETQRRKLQVLMNKAYYEGVIDLCHDFWQYTENSEAYYQMLIDSYLYSGLFEEAKTLGGEIILLNPLNNLFKDSYCLALHETGDTEQAVEYAYEALDLSLWSEFAYEVLTRYYYSEGDYIAASNFGSIASLFDVSTYQTCITTVESYISMKMYDVAENELNYFISRFGEDEETGRLEEKISEGRKSLNPI